MNDRIGEHLKVQRSALNILVQRQEMIASNIANAESLVTPEGGPYRRKEVTFATVMKDAASADSRAGGIGGITVASIRTSNEPLKTVYDPQHPMANKDGFVQMPNVNVTKEMVDMVAAQRSYEANLSAMKAYREIMRSSLSILKR